MSNPDAHIAASPTRSPESIGDPAAPDGSGGIDYERLYRYRHRGVGQEARQSIWNQIAPYIFKVMGNPDRVLDPAAGRCEFINAVPARERWMIDAVEYPEAHHESDVKAMFGDARLLDLPAAYFDGIFISNLLEHFTSQEEVAEFLAKMRRSTRPGGRVVVLGPNFRYSAKNYFDFADHTLALTHVAVEEHLYAAGYEIVSVVPRFLPYSFNGVLPASGRLAQLYLRLPLAWRLLGKQFLVVGQLPASAS